VSAFFYNSVDNSLCVFNSPVPHEMCCERVFGYGLASYCFNHYPRNGVPGQSEAVVRTNEVILHFRTNKPRASLFLDLLGVYDGLSFTAFTDSVADYPTQHYFSEPKLDIWYGNNQNMNAELDLGEMEYWVTDNPSNDGRPFEEQLFVSLNTGFLILRRRGRGGNTVAVSVGQKKALLQVNDGRVFSNDNYNYNTSSHVLWFSKLSRQVQEALGFFVSHHYWYNSYSLRFSGSFTSTLSVNSNWRTHGRAYTAMLLNVLF